MDLSEHLIIEGVEAEPTRRHVLDGIIKENDVGAVRRVVVFLRSDMSVVASTFSHSDGTWEISNTNEYPVDSLYAIAFDDSGIFNARIADFVSQTTSS